jgi:hypothetical protein
MREPSTFVGLDAHKDTIVVAMLLPGVVPPVEWKIVDEAGAVRRLARKLQREARGHIHCGYEAGPCGYVLQRQLESAGIHCSVVAPSLIPVKPGQHIKTDRRDARKLLAGRFPCAVGRNRLPELAPGARSRRRLTADTWETVRRPSARDRRWTAAASSSSHRTRAGVAG